MCTFCHCQLVNAANTFEVYVVCNYLPWSPRSVIIRIAYWITIKLWFPFTLTDNCSCEGVNCLVPNYPGLCLMYDLNTSIWSRSSWFRHIQKGGISSRISSSLDRTSPLIDSEVLKITLFLDNTNTGPRAMWTILWSRTWLLNIRLRTVLLESPLYLNITSMPIIQIPREHLIILRAWHRAGACMLDLGHDVNSDCWWPNRPWTV